MLYVQLAAMSGQVMNKLLEARNKRKGPRLDDKIIVSWNGMMIDAFAHAGKLFDIPAYVERAQKAAAFLLEQAIDNEGELKRIIAGGRAQLDATLEDYAFLVKGLLSLWRADADNNWLEAASSLMARAREFFEDKQGGYFAARESEQLLVRIKSGDDSSIANANAVMLHNMIDLFEITKDKVWRNRAQAMADYFLSGKERVLTESATMVHAALRLCSPSPLEGEGRGGGMFAKNKPHPLTPSLKGRGNLESAATEAVLVTAALFPADARPGDSCELIITLDIKEGWHINANPSFSPPPRAGEGKGGGGAPFLIPTQVEVQGREVTLASVAYPEPLRKKGAEGEALLVYEGLTHVTARLKLTGKGKKRQPIKAMVRFQPCHGTTCHKVADVSLVC